MTIEDGKSLDAPTTTNTATSTTMSEDAKKALIQYLESAYLVENIDWTILSTPVAGGTDRKSSFQFQEYKLYYYHQ